MNEFGALVDRLACINATQDQIRLLTRHLQSRQPEDRHAIAALLAAPPKARRTNLTALCNHIREQTGPVPFALSEDFVGDRSETIALLWPSVPGLNRAPAIAEVVQKLSEIGPANLPRQLELWLNACDTGGRHALIRLATGMFRSPVEHKVLEHACTSLNIRLQQPPDSKVKPSNQSSLFDPAMTGSAGSIRAVILYVHRGPSRASELSCTIAVRHQNVLVPVGKVSCGGHTPAIEAFSRLHALQRFGPTTKVQHIEGTALLLEVEFDSVAFSSRHKAGVSLQSSRIRAVIDDALLASASGLDDLTKLLPTLQGHD